VNAGKGETEQVSPGARRKTVADGGSFPAEGDSHIPGVHISIFAENSPVALRVRTGRKMAEWVPFVTDPLREESRKIATTIEYRGDLYAIAEQRREGSQWVYDLVPWPAGEMVRRRIPLTREYFADLESEERRERHREVGGKVSVLLGFFLAFLPQSFQEKLSEEYDYDSFLWTAINSGTIGLVALGVLAYGLLSAGLSTVWSGEAGFIRSPAAPITLYVLLDSLARFVGLLVYEEALGVLLLEIPDRILRLLLDLLREKRHPRD